MKQYRPFKRIMFMLLVAIIVLACSAITGGATSVPEATNPPVQAMDTAVVVPPTATDPPTVAPEPTATIESTPAPVGVPVKSEKFEVTVIGAVNLERIYPGGTYLYTPNAGNIIVDVGVKVSNLTGSSVSVKWENVYVVEQNGDAWFPTWGSYKESGKKVDPFSLGISDANINGDDVITFNNDIYLRLIYIVTEADPTTFVFGFDDSPLIEIVVKK